MLLKCVILENPSAILHWTFIDDNIMIWSLLHPNTTVNVVVVAGSKIDIDTYVGTYVVLEKAYQAIFW